MRAGSTRQHIPLLLALFIFGALSCAPPTSLATFARDADNGISAGTPVFAEIHDSCVRRRADEGRLIPEYPHAGPSPAASAGESVCTSFATEAKELESVSSVLSAYFRTMQELAAFDEANASYEAEHAGQNLGTAAILSASQTDSIAKLSGLITQAITGHYQRRKLVEFLQTADPHVAAISQALETVVTKDYGSLLDEEERAIKRRYQEVSSTKEIATVMLLNRAYAEDLNALERRRTMAKAYAAILKEARDGHHLLATSNGRFNKKEISLVLQPYISQLQALTPTIQTLP